MTFRDIFKSGFLARTAQLSVADMAVSMLLAFAIGLFIFYIYKKSYRGVMYSANFGTSLIAVALVTTFVMLAVTSNVVLSLGMVGALSIVRFRTAVKDPMDIAFLFWSLDEERPYILVVHCADETAERAARDFAASRVKALSLKSKSVSPGRVELNYEVRLSDGAADFVNALAALPGVENAVLVSYNGDYAA